MVARGDWALAQPGVYRSTAVARSYRQRALAVCLSICDPVSASHLTAASMWCLSGVDATTTPASPVHVSVPHSRRVRSRPGVRLHRTRHYNNADVTTLDSIPVTTLARTVVVLASQLDRAHLTAVIDDTLCRRLVKLPELQPMAARVGAPGTRCAGPLKQELRWWEENPQLDSVAEAALLRMLAGRAIPRPSLRYAVRHLGRAIARVDVAWPGQRVGLEMDGFQFHTGPASSGRQVHAEPVDRRRLDSSPNHALGDEGRRPRADRDAGACGGAPSGRVRLDGVRPARPLVYPTSNSPGIWSQAWAANSSLGTMFGTQPSILAGSAVRGGIRIRR